MASRHGGRTDGDARVRGRRRRWREAAALGSALLALSACGGGTQTSVEPVASASPASHRRPTSYDPPGPPGDPWGPYIREASRRFDVPERWIREVMRQESGGRATATSHAGAMGLMQVMPGTYAELRYRHGLGDDPYHPYDSVMAGAAYIRQMYDLYGSPAFLAAYNGGPRRLEDYLWGGRGLPAETRNYVARIGPRIEGSHPSRRAPPEVYAAAEIPLSIPPGPRRADGATMLALREQREQRRSAEPPVQVASLPPGPVVRMDPIPDGSTAPPPPPVQVASLGGLGGVVRMDPIPDGSTTAAPPPPPRSSLGGAAQGGVVRMDPIPNPPEPEPSRVATPEPVPPPPSRLAAPPPPAPSPSRGFDVAAVSRAEAATAPFGRSALPPPPAAPPGGPVGGSALGAAAASPRAQVAEAVPSPMRGAVASPSFAAPPPSPPAAPGGRSSLGLFSTAQAATLRLPPPAPPSPSPSSSNGWAVQVGAFASENLARAAANAARDGVAAMGSRVVVQPVVQGRTTLYRARVVGLSRDAAQSACGRLRARGDCSALSPDAQL